MLPWSKIGHIAITSVATIDGEAGMGARRLALAANPIATAAILARRYDA